MQTEAAFRINFNLIDSIAAACHRIGIDVIAEGSETEKDLRICREIGINLVQGFNQPPLYRVPAFSPEEYPWPFCALPETTLPASA